MCNPALSLVSPWFPPGLLSFGSLRRTRPDMRLPHNVLCCTLNCRKRKEVQILVFNAAWKFRHLEIRTNIAVPIHRGLSRQMALMSLERMLHVLKMRVSL
jgi:hypothetical protein